MSGIINRGSFPKALKEGVKGWFGDSYDEKPLQCNYLFETVSSSRAYEEDVLSTGTGLAPAKPEGASVKYDSMSQGYVNRADNVTYALGIQITREEMEDNQYPGLLDGMLNKRAGQLAKSMRQTKELVAANIYNNGFDTGVTYGDGKAMLAADHPTKAGDFSNVLAVAADLSETSVETALIQIRKFTDDRGKIIAAKGESLIVSSENTYEAERILKSNLQTTVASVSTTAITNTNAINAIQGKLMPVTNDYLTDADAWFIRTDVNGLVNYQRREVEFTEDNDFDTENMKFKGSERYSFTCFDPRAIVGSEGAS
jgi:hypothetical protein